MRALRVIDDAFEFCACCKRAASAFANEFYAFVCLLIPARGAVVPAAGTARDTMSKAERLVHGESLMTHAMLFTGARR